MRITVLLPVAAALAVFTGGCTGDGADADGGPDGAPDDDPPQTEPDPDPGAACVDPGPDAPVTARYTVEPSTFEGFDVLVSLPDPLRAVVFYFYGSDDVVEWTGGYEQTAVANLLYDLGVGYVVTDRTAPGSGARWDDQTLPAGDNPDLARLDRLRADLIASGALSADTPVVSEGFSDGGAFSLFFARVAADELGWPIAAVLAHSAGASSALPDVPTWTTAGVHDLPSGLDGAEQVYDDQVARGITARYERVDERALSAEVFLRNPDWDAAKAAEVMADVVAAGLVDPSGARLVTDDEIDHALSAYGQDSAMRGAAIAESRIRVVWATHRYNAVPASSACAFTRDALGL